MRRILTPVIAPVVALSVGLGASLALGAVSTAVSQGPSGRQVISTAGPAVVVAHAAPTRTRKDKE
jgi:hypothetical protein